LQPQPGESFRQLLTLVQQASRHRNQ
jgi:hypothetical protein